MGFWLATLLAWGCTAGDFDAGPPGDGSVAPERLAAAGWTGNTDGFSLSDRASLPDRRGETAPPDLRLGEGGPRDASTRDALHWPRPSLKGISSWGSDIALAGPSVVAPNGDLFLYSADSWTSAISGTTYMTDEFTKLSAAGGGASYPVTYGYGSPTLSGSVSGLGVDPQGSLLVVGKASGRMTFFGKSLSFAGNGVFLAKLDSSLSLVQLDKSFRGNGTAELAGVAAAPSSAIHVVGSFTGSMPFGGSKLRSAGKSDLLVGKLKPGGKPLWAFSAGGSGNDYGGTIVVDRAGNSVVAAVYEGTITLGGKSYTAAGGKDALVFELDGSGKVRWATSIGGPGDDGCAGLGLAGSGVLCLANFTGSFRAGSIALTATGKRDVALVRLNRSGAVEWASSAAHGDEVYGSDLAIDAKGRIYMVGGHRGSNVLGTTAFTSTCTYDAFIARFSRKGKPQWALSTRGRKPHYTTHPCMYAIGAAGCSAWFQTVGVDSAGTVVVAGSAYSISSFLGKSFGHCDSDYSNTWTYASSVVSLRLVP